MFPQDSHIRNVYKHSATVEYALEASLPLECIFDYTPTCCDCFGWSNWTGWANISYFEKDGRSYVYTVPSGGPWIPPSEAITIDSSSSSSTSERTEGIALNNNSVRTRDLTVSSKICNWAINFGLKHYFRSCDCDCRPYLGFGIGGAHVQYQDRSIYVKEDIKMWGFCLLAKAGIEYNLCYNFFLDLFVDYSSNWFAKPDSKHNIGTRKTNTGGVMLGLGLGYHF